MVHLHGGRIVVPCHKFELANVLRIVKGTMTALMDGGGKVDGTVAARQEASEFELLFYEHYEPVVRLLTRLTGSRAQADELANEVFWRLSRRPASVLSQENVAPWLYRTAINLGIDTLRAARNRQRYERDAGRDALQQTKPDALEDLVRREQQRRVQHVLSKIKPVRAQLLLMRSCGWPYRQMAEALGLATGSVGTLLNRAEVEFRKRYLEVVKKEEKK